MRLLLHICCAPCLIYPYERLREKGFELTGFFYNPNIHPFSEYNNRRLALDSYAKNAGIEIIYPEYRPQEYFRAVNMLEDKLERCSICWRQRFNTTVQFAKKAGFGHFSSTLLVSPYQDMELLGKIGEDAARGQGLQFYYEDFRPGFRKAHNQAKIDGIYCQKYCGCIYSEIERCRKSVKY